MKKTALVMILGLAFALSGCGGKKDDDEGSGKGQPSAGQGPRGSVPPNVKLPGGMEIDFAKRKVTGEDPESGAKIEFGPGTKIWDGFPKDVYLYSPAQVQAAGHKGEEGTLQLMTDDSVDKVLGAYSAKMKANGWTEKTPPIPLAQMKVRQYTKGDRNVTVIVHAADKKTLIKLAVGKD